jgi:dimethylargininase
MPIAITREVSRSLGDCELSYVDRAAIDVGRAIAQHADYCRALESLGCDVIALAAEDAFPDAVFVEDVAIVLDELAVVTRPGAPSRRGEAASVAAALHGHRTLRTIEAPATIDGGDVLRIGRTIYVGESARTSADGVAQLRAIAADFGYAVQPVPIRGCLHLKSAVSELADGIVLINPAWVDRAAFAAFDRIEIDPDEPHAANALRIGDGAIYPASFPRTLRRIRDRGITPALIDVSELQKAEGAVTCCSLVFAGALK